jgi:hypothetical protein
MEVSPFSEIANFARIMAYPGHAKRLRGDKILTSEIRLKYPQTTVKSANQ